MVTDDPGQAVNISDKLPLINKRTVMFGEFCSKANQFAEKLYGQIIIIKKLIFSIKPNTIHEYHRVAYFCQTPSQMFTE